MSNDEESVKEILKKRMASVNRQSSDWCPESLQAIATAALAIIKLEQLENSIDEWDSENGCIK